jgi:hypothetical protein
MCGAGGPALPHVRPKGRAMGRRSAGVLCRTSRKRFTQEPQGVRTPTKRLRKASLQYDDDALIPAQLDRPVHRLIGAIEVR